MKKELLKGLTEEQIKKVEACKNSDEILALAKAEGVQLSEEQLAAVSGGGCGSTADPVKCNQCGSLNCEKYGKKIYGLMNGITNGDVMIALTIGWEVVHKNT